MTDSETFDGLPQPCTWEVLTTELQQAKIPFTCFQIQRDITYKVDKEQLHKQRENTGEIEQQQQHAMPRPCPAPTVPCPS